MRAVTNSAPSAPTLSTCSSSPKVNCRTTGLAGFLSDTWVPTSCSINSLTLLRESSPFLALKRRRSPLGGGGGGGGAGGGGALCAQDASKQMAATTREPLSMAGNLTFRL